MKYLSQRQVADLKRALIRYRAKGHGTKEYVYSLYIELMLETAMRAHELCSMRVSQLNFTDSELRLNNPAKNSKRGDYSISPRLMKLLEDAVTRARLGVNDYLTNLSEKPENTILGRRRALDRFWERLRLDAFGHGFDKGVHCIRHTGAVAIYAASRDPVAVQHSLRHKSIQTTNHYLATLIMPNIREAVDAFMKSQMEEV